MPARKSKNYKNLEKFNRYTTQILATWREALRAHPEGENVPFSKEDIVRHGEHFRRGGIETKATAVKNVPDIIYTFRARADLPDEILKGGSYAITGRGKGLYAFVRIPIPNRFTQPTRMEEISLPNQIPGWVRSYLGRDEQGMLTLISHHDLLQRYLGLNEVFRLQSHLRMSVSGYGQVEVDEFYAGVTASGKHVIIGVEAKDGHKNGLLNVSQLFGTAKALKAKFPHLEKRLVGIKPDSIGRICMCEFSVPDHVQDLREVGAWKAYKLV